MDLSNKNSEETAQQKRTDEFMEYLILVAAHEIRTPASVIRGDTEILKMKFKESLDAEAVKVLESIERNSIQILKLLESLLSLDVFEGRKMNFGKVEFDIVKVVNEVASDLGEQAEERGLYIKVVAPDGPLEVVADPDKTREVVANVLRNSIQYTDKGGTAVSFEKNSNFVKISVSDTGRGIDSKKQELIFKTIHLPQDRDEKNKQYGSGLGLYISKFFVEAMGGKIWLERSGPNLGTVFSVNLPTKILTKTNMNNKPLILLVDDEEDILNIYSTALSQAGFEVVTSSNGAEAIEITKQKHPSLILMDVKMPEMNGVEAVLKLRQDSSTADTKIVFITAFDDPRLGMDFKVAEVIGTIDVIKKGLSLNELVSKVKIYLAS